MFDTRESFSPFEMSPATIGHAYSYDPSAAVGTFMAVTPSA
jgi:hypothetical protein